MLDIIVWNAKDIIGLCCIGFSFIVIIIGFLITYLRARSHNKRMDYAATVQDEDKKPSYTIGRHKEIIEWMSADEYQPTTFNGKSRPVWALCDNNGTPKVCVYHSNKRWYEVEKGRFASVQLWAVINKPPMFITTIKD